MFGIVAAGIFILPQHANDYDRFLPDVEVRLNHELPRMFCDIWESSTRAETRQLSAGIIRRRC
jgi:hypothetical protein